MLVKELFPCSDMWMLGSDWEPNLSVFAMDMNHIHMIHIHIIWSLLFTFTYKILILVSNANRVCDRCGKFCCGKNVSSHRTLKNRPLYKKYFQSQNMVPWKFEPWIKYIFCHYDSEFESKINFKNRQKQVSNMKIAFKQ